MTIAARFKKMAEEICDNGRIDGECREYVMSEIYSALQSVSDERLPTSLQKEWSTTKDAEISRLKTEIEKLKAKPDIHRLCEHYGYCICSPRRLCGREIQCQGCGEDLDGRTYHIVCFNCFHGWPDSRKAKAMRDEVKRLTGEPIKHDNIDPA